MNFARFESLLDGVAEIFIKMQDDFPEEICCKVGCSDCCHACFDVSLVEAEYIKKGLQTLNEQQLARINDLAEQAKTEIGRLKAVVDADPIKELHQEIGLWRVQCPLLQDNKECVLYKYRPITCRVYGLPTSIANKGHVCGFTGFAKGKSYPTVKLDQIIEHLQAISLELADETGLSGEMARSRRFLYGIILEH